MAIHEKEAARLDEVATKATANAQALELDLREACAALATVREQRNQAARESEASRLAADASHDELSRGSDLIAAAEGRVGAAERRAAQQQLALDTAQRSLEEERGKAAADRARRQKRMINVLLRTSRMRRAGAFDRWCGAAAAIDAAHALTLARQNGAAAAAAETEASSARDALSSATSSNERVAALGRVLRGSTERRVGCAETAVAFGRWTRKAEAIERAATWWAALTRRAVRTRRLYRDARMRPGGRLGWVLTLHERSRRRMVEEERGGRREEEASGGGTFERLVATHHTLTLTRCMRMRTVFALWRSATSGAALRERVAVAEAEAEVGSAGLHVGAIRAGHWWEAP